jgi:hypothetical protein
LCVGIAGSAGRCSCLPTGRRLRLESRPWLATAHVAHGGPVDGDALAAGFHVAFLVGSGFAFAGALVAAIFLARRRPVVAPAATATDAPHP